MFAPEADANKEVLLAAAAAAGAVVNAGLPPPEGMERTRLSDVVLVVDDDDGRMFALRRCTDDETKAVVVEAVADPVVRNGNVDVPDSVLIVLAAKPSESTAETLRQKKTVTIVERRWTCMIVVCLFVTVKT